MLTMGDTSKMQAVAEVYETDISRVRLGQTATVSSRALTNPLTGRVVRIGSMIFKNDVLNVDPAARADARVVEVWIELDDPAPAAQLTNLTVNAIKFTPAGGAVHLSLSEAPADPEFLQVSVRDTGRGIPEDQVDLIFNRLYQVNQDAQSAESRNGLGLGLYICQELVGLHGGRIWVENQVKKGSTFSFVIPKHARAKGAHVLIVDDDSGIRNASPHPGKSKF
jgi:signal transduction histidine kinase